MKAWFWGVGAFALLLSCSSDESAFLCSDSASCADDGTCEPTGFCSFPDDGCASGRRYGEHSGTLSQQCVPLEMGSSSGGGGSSTTGIPPTTTLEPTTDANSTGEEPPGESSSTGGDEESTGSSTGVVELSCTREEFFTPPPETDWSLSVVEDAAEAAFEQGTFRVEIHTSGQPTVVGLATPDPIDLNNAVVETVITERQGTTEPSTVSSGLFILGPGGTHAVALHVHHSSVAVENNSDGTSILEGALSLTDVPLPLVLRLSTHAGAVRAEVEDEAGENYVLWDGPSLEWLDSATLLVGAIGRTDVPPSEGSRFQYLELCLP